MARRLTTTGPAARARRRAAPRDRAGAGSGGLVVVDGAAGAGKTALLDAARRRRGLDGLLSCGRGAPSSSGRSRFGVVRQLFERLRDRDACSPARRASPRRWSASSSSVAGARRRSRSPPATRCTGWPRTSRPSGRWRCSSTTRTGRTRRRWACSRTSPSGSRASRSTLVVASRARVSRRRWTRCAGRRRGRRRAAARRGRRGRRRALVRRRRRRRAVPRLPRRDRRQPVPAARARARRLADGARRPRRRRRAEPGAGDARDRGAAGAAARRRAVALAQAAAVLGGGVPLRQAEALAGIVSDAARAADALIAGGVLRSAHPLEFLHPLIGAAVYAGMGPAARSREHAPRGAAAGRGRRDRPSASRRSCCAARRRAIRGRSSGSSRRRAQRRRAARPTRSRPTCSARSRSRRRRSGAPTCCSTSARAECQFDPAAAVAHLREALAGRDRGRAALRGDDAARRRARPDRAAWPRRPTCSRTQFDAFAGAARTCAGRPRRRWPTSPGSTRDAPARGRARSRGCARGSTTGERDPAVLGHDRRRDGDGGRAGRARWPSSPSAPSLGLRRRARPPPPAGPGTTPSRSLVVGERYDVALRALDDALERARERGAVIDVGGVLTFRAELFAARSATSPNAEVDARTLHEISVGYGWPLGARDRGVRCSARCWSSAASSTRPRRCCSAGRSRRRGDGARTCYTNVLVLLGARAPAAGPGPLRRGGRGAARVRPPGDRDRPPQPGACCRGARSSRRRCSSSAQTAEARWLARDELEPRATRSAGGGRSGSRCARRRGSRRRRGAPAAARGGRGARRLGGAARARARALPRSASALRARGRRRGGARAAAPRDRPRAPLRRAGARGRGAGRAAGDRRAAAAAADDAARAR